MSSKQLEQGINSEERNLFPTADIIMKQLREAGVCVRNVIQVHDEFLIELSTPISECQIK